MIPIFIGGVGRSGTTTTKQCFRHHPKVWGVSGEFRFMHPGNVAELDPEKYLWDYLMHVYKATALKRPESVWVEDSPENVCVFDQLIEKFPGSVCIHAMRHPLATLNSMMAHTGGGSYWPIGLELSARRVHNVYEHFERAQGDRVLASRLEDLVVNPEPFLRHVCDLVEIPYMPKMTMSLDRRKLNARRIKGFTPEELEIVAPILQPVIEKWYPES